MTNPTSYAEQGLLPLRALLVDEGVNEVVINPDGSIWVEYAQKGHMERWDGTIPPERLNALGNHLAGGSKNQLGKHHPIVSGRVHVFGQSMRVQVVVPPAIETGVSVSIRKYVSRILDLDEGGFLMGAEINVENQRLERLEELRGRMRPV